jgi:quercetin dioxygenase-like cupin family protein
MATEYTFFPDLTREADIPENGILSRTLFQDDHTKVILFGFAAGQELSAHTAPMKASILVLDGSCSLTLGSDTKEGVPGTWVMMEPKLEHGIRAITPTRMLLTMHKQAR